MYTYEDGIRRSLNAGLSTQAQAEAQLQAYGYSSYDALVLVRSWRV